MEKQEIRLQMKNKIYFLVLATIMWVATVPASAQYAEKDTTVAIDYSRTPRRVAVKNIAVDGIPNYDESLLVRLSGIAVGDYITIPGEDITKAIKRYWKNGLFSNVSIAVDSIIRDSAYIHIHLAPRPRISQINYNGVRKSEKTELQEKLGLLKDNQLTPNMIDRAKILAKRYFDEKGFKNAEVEILRHDDPAAPDKVIVDVNIDKKGKIVIRSIDVIGNTVIKDSKLKGGWFSKGVLKTIREKRGIRNWFRKHKFSEA